MREHYCHVPVYVMANGAQEDPAHFKDSLRVYYLYNYINEALKGETRLVWSWMRGVTGVSNLIPDCAPEPPPWTQWSLIITLSDSDP